MKKILILSTLLFSLLALTSCHSRKTKTIFCGTTTNMNDNMEMKTEEKSNKTISLKYCDKNNEKLFLAIMTSKDSFENATLSYSIEGSTSKTVSMKRKVSASGVIMESENEEVEYLAKGKEALFIINGRKFETYIAEVIKNSSK